MKGSHDWEQYPKRLLLLMKAWILLIVWDVVSMVEFLWLWANPHQAWDAYMSLLRTLERKTSCSSSSCMPWALSSLNAYNELPHEDNKSSSFLRVWHQFRSMLIQYEFSRSTALVSQTGELVSHPTCVGWLFRMVLITPHAVIWVFTTPYQCIFLYAIIGHGYIELGLTLDAI